MQSPLSRCQRHPVDLVAALVWSRWDFWAVGCGITLPMRWEPPAIHLVVRISDPLLGESQPPMTRLSLGALPERELDVDTGAYSRHLGV